MVRALVFGGLAMLAAAFATPAVGQQVFCLDHAKLDEKLAADHRETPRGIGLTADGRLLELYASPAGTWTLLLTTPNGVSCVVTFGDAWQSVPVKEDGPGA